MGDPRHLLNGSAASYATKGDLLEASRTLIDKFREMLPKSSSEDEYVEMVTRFSKALEKQSDKQLSAYQQVFTKTLEQELSRREAVFQEKFLTYQRDCDVKVKSLELAFQQFKSLVSSLPTPIIHVNVPEQQVVVNLPEIRTPDVHVSSPEVTVHIPETQVSISPQIHLPPTLPAEVVVNVPAHARKR